MVWSSWSFSQSFTPMSGTALAAGAWRDSTLAPAASAVPLTIHSTGPPHVSVRVLPHWQKLTGRSGILELMDDLGRALTTSQMRMLGGGNPAAVPEIQALWRRRMSELLADGAAFDGMLGNYDPPQGNPRFLAALGKLLRERMGWQNRPRESGHHDRGQTAFFYLFKLLAGTFDEPRLRRAQRRFCCRCVPSISGTRTGTERRICSWLVVLRSNGLTAKRRESSSTESTSLQ